MVISITYIFNATEYLHREQSHNYLQIFDLLWSLLLLQLCGTWAGGFKIQSRLVRPPLPLEEEKTNQQQQKHQPKANNKQPKTKNETKKKHPQKTHTKNCCISIKSH